MSGPKKCSGAALRQHRNLSAEITPPVRVATWLTERERRQVEAAAASGTILTHRDTVFAVREDLSASRCDAALVSVALVEPRNTAHIRGLVRGFPHALAIGLVADTDEPQALAGTLLLGSAGVSIVIDGRVPSGWYALRSALRAPCLPYVFQRTALTTVLRELQGDLNEEVSPDETRCSTGCTDFFRAVFSPGLQHGKHVAACLGTNPSTLTSRFYRAGLPSPRRYLVTARLVWAAHLGESLGRSTNDIAFRLGASSPQSLGRTIRSITGLSTRQFRYALTGKAMLKRFCEALVVPYRDTLRSFDPLSSALIRNVARGSTRNTGDVPGEPMESGGKARRVQAA